MLFRLLTGGSRLRAGDLVEVRSQSEILSTLDAQGTLDKLPFMPEMLSYCGRRFRVASVAHKSCDTINPISLREIRRAVFLEGMRCDGKAHGGCQAACTIFWREEWLKKVDAAAAPERKASVPHSAVCSLETLTRECRQSPAADGVVRYKCQATELVRATKLLKWWSPRPYLVDVLSRNYSAFFVLRTLFLGMFRRVIEPGVGYRILVATYNRLARLLGGREYCVVTGAIPKNAPTPVSEVVFRVGDLVRVRPHAEICKTLNVGGYNRGMLYDAEMAGHCGKTFPVRAVVTQIINERTGEMMQMKQPCIMLEGAICRSDYSKKRLMCPRAIYSYWRPLWLEKLPGDSESHV